MSKNAGGRPRKEMTTITELTKLYYSMDEAAEILGVHRNTIKNRIKAGDIEGVKIGRQYRIPREELEYKPSKKKTIRASQQTKVLHKEGSEE